MSVLVENISKSFGSQKALEHVSFELSKGELTGFLGPNGAGKSTLMKIITGYLSQDEGNICINGRPASPEKFKARKEIGYLPENNPLYTDLYVTEYLMLTAGFYPIEKKKARIKEIIEMTGLGQEQHKKIQALSKGYRQRVGLAQALIHNPSVLILDEPTTGLDPNQLEEIRTLIRVVSQEKTVLFSTHIMQEVEAICKRVLIINKGHLVADSPVETLKSGSFHEKQQIFVEFDKAIDKQSLFENMHIYAAEQQGKNSFLVTSGQQHDLRPDLFRFAVKQGLVILTMKEKQASIGYIFQELTRQTETIQKR